MAKGHLVMKNNFTDKEMTCNCGCELNLVTDETLNKLNTSRLLSDFPYIINSATRCKLHNKAVGGVEDSDHIYGTGFDIRYANGKQLFKIIINSNYAGFTRIFIYKTFVHIGLPRENKKNDIIELKNE